MPVNPEDVLADLKKGKYAPLYFLQGDEPFFIDQISDYIEAHALQEQEKGFNQLIMYGKDTDLNTIMANAKKFPMMSDKQVVIVKEAQELKDLAKDIDKHTPLKNFNAYLSNPLPSTILVFCHKYGKLDARKALSKSLDKFAVNVESKKMYDNQLPDFVKKYMAAQNRKITDKAVFLICEHVGNNLSRLTKELDKIYVNLKPEETLTDEHIHKFVGISKEYNIFEFQKALASKQGLTCYKIAQFLARDKESNINMSISSLYKFFQKIMIVKSSKGASRTELAAAIGVNPYFMNDFELASRNYSLPKLFDIITVIKDADLQSKGVNAGSMDEEQILKEMVYRILR
jgi:DNA polymerase III subunit delta